jgi:5'-deoxynucleotidase YfbR-like HD superfamily hydrolase
VSSLVTPPNKLKALLHDASEAYLSDVVRPLKYSSAFNSYFELEDRITQAIFDRFGLDYDMPPEIKHADNIMLLTEHRDLRKPGTKLWDDFEKWGITPLATTLIPRTQREAKHDFLKVFHMLYKGSN